MDDGLVYAFAMIAFLGGFALWDWMATRQQQNRGSGTSNSRSAQEDQLGQSERGLKNQSSHNNKHFVES